MIRSALDGTWALLLMFVLALSACQSNSPPTRAMITGPILRPELGMHSAPIQRLSADANGRFLLTASNDKTARLWSLQDGHLLTTFHPPQGPENEGKLYAGALSPDGSLAAVGGWTGVDSDHQAFVYLFDTASGQMRHRISTGETTTVHQLVFSPDGRFLIVCLAPNEGFQVWRTDNWTLARYDTDNRPQDAIYGAAFDRAGRLVTVSPDDGIRLYDSSFRFIRMAMAPKGSGAFSVAFSPDGRQIAVGYINRIRVDVFSADDLQLLFSPDASGINNIGATNGLSVVAWSLDGQTLYAAGDGKDSQHRTIVRAWSKAGHGAFQDQPISSNNVISLQPLPGGGVVAAGMEPPQWTTVGSARPLSQQSPIADYRDDDAGLRLSSDGRTVGFGFERNGQRPAVMSLADRTALRLVTALPPGLDSLTASASGITVSNWKQSKHPMLNGQDLFDSPQLHGPNEVSNAAAAGYNKLLLGTNFSLRLFDHTGAQIWRKSAPSVTWAVNISADGRLAVAAYADGTIRWYRASDGEELLAFLPHKDGKRWVMWTPSGYYDASLGGEDLINWTINRGKDQAADAFPVSSFRDQFFRPDIVAAVLNTLDERQSIVEANAKRPGRSPTVADITKIEPPVLAILSPRDGDATAGSPVTVRYSVRSPSGIAVTKVRVIYDGSAEDAKGPGSGNLPTAGNVDAIESTLTLNPPAGTNYIGLQAETASGSSVPQVLRLLPNPKPVVTKPKLYALAVGVSAYAHPELKLNYSAKDADDFAGVMKTHSKLYRDTEIRILDDSRASRAAILDGLAWLEQSVGPGDVAMLFLSGHGDQDPTGAYYYLPQNADPTDLHGTGISNAELLTLVSQIRGKIVLFLDTCHAGAVLSARSDALANQLYQHGAVVFASSTGDQSSLESPIWNNGAFTKALVEGLAGGADMVHRGNVTVTGLDDYLEFSVPQLTENRQTPIGVRPPTVPNFAIAQ